MSKIMKAVYSSGAYWCINKNVSLAIGDNASKLLMEHVWLSDTNNNKYKITRKHLANTLNITDRTQVKLEDKLIQMKLLTRKINKSGGTNQYTVRTDNIVRFIKNPFQYLEDCHIQPFGKPIIKSCTPVAGHRGTPVAGHTHSNEQYKIKDYLRNQGSADADPYRDGKVRQGKPIRRKLGVKRAKPKKPLPNPNGRKVNKTTIAVIHYWNSKSGLTKHTLKMNGDVVAPFEVQNKTIKSIDCQIRKVIRGTLYKPIEELPPNLRREFKYTENYVRNAIDRFHIAMTNPLFLPINKPKKKPTLDCFFINPYVAVFKGDNPYIARYPFLHYNSNLPIKATNTVIVADKYPALTKRIITALYPNGQKVKQEVINICAKVSARVLQLVEGVNKDERVDTLRAVPELLVMALEERYKRIQVDDLNNGYFIESNFSQFLDRKGFKVRGAIR